jgi:hypothetical protein
MPLAKTAEVVKDIIFSKPTTPSTGISKVESVVNPELYNFFNVKSDESNAHLGYINEWAKNNSKNTGEALRNLRNIELKMGQPGVGETRLSKLYNYLRLSDNIKSTSLKMADELNSSVSRSKGEIARLRADKNKEIGKITDKINEIESKYRDAVKYYRTNITNSSLNIKKQYEGQLKELKTMREAYKGR